MPNFDFQGVYIAEYKKTDSGYDYGKVIEMGDPMTCNLQMKYAEGRLYAKGGLREYKKIPVGGSLSVAVKYIHSEAQSVMFRKTEKTRTINGKEVVSSALGTKNIPQYVGIGAYGADVVDGKDCFSAIFAHKTIFGAPGYAYSTKGETITFQTPTTTGEFLPSDIEDELMVEDIIVDTSEEAINWINACFGKSEAAAAAKAGESADTIGAGLTESEVSN